MVGQKIYVGVKILGNAKAEIFSKNAQKRARQKTLNYAVGPKIGEKCPKNALLFSAKMGSKHIGEK